MLEDVPREMSFCSVAAVKGVGNGQGSCNVHVPKNATPNNAFVLNVAYCATPQVPQEYFVCKK